MLQRLHQQGPIVKGGGEIFLYFLCYTLPTSLTGAVHDELCRQVFKTLGASGCAIRGTERRCAAINLTEAVIAKRCRRGYERRVSTKVGCGSTHLLYRPSPINILPSLLTPLSW